ncbi:MAG: hypothetical protein MOIL_01520 [Candidatus Methanolliviera sp. GoM_oil]|nr:MAG: hypothetical protein MOIL_01520 [Candidatus Methanolliviera sp. GoM_oil]
MEEGSSVHIACDLQEKIMDKVLLLYLIGKAKEEGNLGVTKLMKLTFLTEQRMAEDRVKGFNYWFYKWRYGPFTQEIYDDLDCLMQNELITERGGIELTDRGLEFLNEIRGLLDENTIILKYIDGIAEEYGSIELNALIDRVDEIEPLGRKKIKDLLIGEHILSKLSDLEADRVFEIDDEWLETLDLLLNKEEYESLKEGMESARITPSRKVTTADL